MGIEGVWNIFTVSVGLIVIISITMALGAFVAWVSDYFIAIAEWWGDKKYCGHTKNAFAKSARKRMEILNKVLGRK